MAFSSELSGRYMSTLGAVVTSCVIGFLGFFFDMVAVQLVFLGDFSWIGFTMRNPAAMVACMGAFALIGFLARRKTASRGLRPRVKEIRSTASKPRVKSIQEAGTKPRVLKIEED